MAYLYGTCSNDKITMCVEYGYSQDLDANTSRVWAKLMYWKDGIYSTTGYGYFWLSINGDTKDADSFWMNLQNGTAYTPVEHAVTIPHNPDGTLTITISAGGGISGTTFDSSSLSQRITLPQIPRQATLTSAPNFTDEENPTITYLNPIGNYSGLTLLQACIASTDGQTIYVPYRDISKTSSTYTFVLTDNERNALRQATPNSNSLAVKFYVKCILNGSTLYDSVQKTMSIVNASPSLGTPVVEDVNSETIYLTGDKNKLIKYFSDAMARFSPTARKYSTIKSKTITNGGKTVSNVNANLFSDVENGNFVFAVVDSRGNASSQTVSKTIIGYVKLSCNVRAVPPTTDGDGSITISGNYWGNNFGAHNNVLILHYRHKAGDGAYGEWQAVTATPTFKNNTFTIKVDVSGLDYRQSHTFQARAADLLMTVDSNEHKVRTTPVFDWGENDFSFNVPVEYVEAPATNTDSAKHYSLSGAAKMLSNVYDLYATVTAGSNWTVNSGSAYLVGGIIRCSFNVTRSSATGTGDITNETVCHFSCNHKGKLNSVYACSFPSASTGGLAAFSITNQSIDDSSLDFDVILTATGSASTSYSAYFILPCAVNVNYWG